MIPRPISDIRRDLATNKAWTAGGGQVAAGSLQSLEAELREATGRRPVRNTKGPCPVSVTFCKGCRTSGIAGTRCRCPLTPKTPARHYTLPELRARAHQYLDADALSDPERLMALPYGAIRDQALRSIEKYGQHLAPTEQDHLAALCHTRTSESDGRHFSRHIALTSSPAYVRAYEKTLKDALPVFDAAEGAAVNAWHQIAYKPTAEERAAGLGGTMGLGVPVLIDPTILIQSQDQAEILGVCGRVLVTTDAWRGVSSGGATLQWKAEGAAVADAAVTLAQPVIPINSADGVFQASYEVFADYPGWWTKLATSLTQPIETRCRTTPPSVPVRTCQPACSRR